MARLSRPIEDIRQHYEIVVIGYGGARSIPIPDW